MTVKVVDGAQLFCTHEAVNCSWSVHGQLFTTTFKVLPLTCYDAILGIQWKQKWLSFSHQGKIVKLHGIPDEPQAGPDITLHQLIAMTKVDALLGIIQVYAVEPENLTPTAIPPEITELVEQFSDIFF